jgi:mono/diheme cytochrome c family protein
MKYLSVLFLVACSSSKPAPTTPSPSSSSSSSSSPTAALDAQVAEGKQLYIANCLSCHGDAGQGTKDGPPVVGKDAFPLEPRSGAKRDVKFHTAADVFAWATKNMPANNPGSLTTEQFLAIFAFDLTANGIKLDKPLDGAAAAAIVLHP